MALGSPQHSGRVRGVGAYVNPSSYFNKPVRHGKHVNEIIKETIKQLTEEERTKRHALAKEMVAVERGYWVDKMTQLEAKIERFPKAQEQSKMLEFYTAKYFITKSATNAIFTKVVVPVCRENSKGDEGKL